MTGQIQCPNCGGFKVDRPSEHWTNDPSCNIAFAVFILFAFPIGTILGLWILYDTLFKPAQKPSPYHYICRLCGYEWEQKPGEVLPINVNPDLIQKGEERLRQLEEEKRKRDDSWWYYQQQQKKR